MLFPVAVLFAGLIASGGSAPPMAIREQCERELALVQHLRRHIANPSDGLALAADRRDLQRRGPGVESDAPTAGAPEGDPFERLTIVADLWYARLVERTPFHLMPRDRLARVEQAQRALGQLQSRATAGERDRFLPDMREELVALTHFIGGSPGSMDADVDLALAIADQAAAGRPVLGYGRPLGPAVPYPPVASGAPMPGPAGAQPVPPTPPPGPVNMSPPPSGSGPTPYTLPAGYANYAPQSAESATASPTGCQVLRQSAGASASTVGMLRAVECWSGLRGWPGWLAQVIESLDWAETYARLDRDCAALGEVNDRVRQFGRAVAPGVQPGDVVALAERTELDRRMLRAQNRCR